MPGNKKLSQIYAANPITTLEASDLVYISRGGDEDCAILATNLSQAGAGTVTSVGMTVPGILSVSGSPVTSSGTLALSLATQTANLVWAGPTTGSAATPTFRALVAADIPSLSSVYQPLNAGLTSISELTTATYGRSLLTLADAAALRTSAGIVTTPATLYVESNGNDTTGTRGDKNLPYATLQEAMNDASAGDTIQLGRGTFAGYYSEALGNLWKNGLTIRGSGRPSVNSAKTALVGGTIITGSLGVNSHNATQALYGLTIENLGIDNGSARLNTTETDAFAFQGSPTYPCDGVNIRNCVALGLVSGTLTVSHGFNLAGTRYSIVSDCEAVGFVHGFAAKTQYSTFVNLICRDNYSDGIISTESLTISPNKFTTFANVVIYGRSTTVGIVVGNGSENIIFTGVTMNSVYQAIELRNAVTATRDMQRIIFSGITASEINNIGVYKSTGSSYAFVDCVVENSSFRADANNKAGFYSGCDITTGIAIRDCSFENFYVGIQMFSGQSYNIRNTTIRDCTVALNPVNGNHVLPQAIISIDNDFEVSGAGTVTDGQSIARLTNLTTNGLVTTSASAGTLGITALSAGNSGVADSGKVPYYASDGKLYANELATREGIYFTAGGGNDLTLDVSAENPSSIRTFAFLGGSSNATFTFQSGGGTVALLDATQTFSNKSSSTNLTFTDTGEGIALHGGGTVTGASGGITATASGTNQNIVLTPSGTGIISIGAGITHSSSGFTISAGGTTQQLTLSGTNSAGGRFATSSGSAITGMWDNVSIRVNSTSSFAIASSGISSPDVSLYRGTTNTFFVGIGSAAGFGGNIKLTNLEAVGTLAVTGASTLTGNVTCAGSIQSNNPTAGIGYATGAGGTVTQLTSRTTGVTINKLSGQITTNTTSLASGDEAAFTVTNSAVVATDVIVLSIASGTTSGDTKVSVNQVSAGSFRILVANLSGGAAETGAVVINFAVLRGASS